jgi:hypothetical protein
MIISCDSGQKIAATKLACSLCYNAARSSLTLRLIVSSSYFDKMLRFDLSRLSVHPVEARAAGLQLPAVRSQACRLSVVLTLALTKPQKLFEVGPRRNGFGKHRLVRKPAPYQSAF